MTALKTHTCARCRSAFDEIAARVPMEAVHDPERCACGSLTSYRWQPEGVTHWVRVRIER